MNTYSRKRNKGFTLVEMIVSIGLFTIVLFIATSAFLTVVNADRKSRAVRIASDNLNLALEDMQRRIRTGSTYYCGALNTDVGGVGDCSTGDTLSFTEQDGVTRTTYTLASNKITREYKCMVNLLCSSFVTYGIPIDVTAPEISITGLKFIVQGSYPASGAVTTDLVQPYVTMVIDGSIVNAANPSLGASFKIQTTVTQRDYDS